MPLTVFAVVVSLVLGSSGAWSQESPPPSLPDEPVPQDASPLPVPLPESAAGAVIKDRNGILADLYDKLARATDKVQADRIAAAIERLWSNSGSDTSDLLISRSATLQDSGNADAAIELLDIAIALADNPEAYNRRAIVYFGKQQYARALADLREVLARDPNQYQAINGLAQILKEFGDKVGALKTLRMLKQVHPFADGVDDAIRELEREVEGQKI